MESISGLLKTWDFLAICSDIMFKPRELKEILNTLQKLNYNGSKDYLVIFKTEELNYMDIE